MHHYILPIITLFCMVVVGSYASTTPDAYWKNVLPNTAMPLALRNLLPHLEWMENKEVSGVDLNPKKRPDFVGMKSTGPNALRAAYWAAAQAHVDPTQALFFLEEDMKVGSHMTFQFTKSLNDATFLTREKANTIPFSSDKVPEILRDFLPGLDSIEVQIVKDTIEECETKANKGEDKYCATSLESMVDFATSTIGKNVKAISTVRNNNNNEVETYTITQVIKTAREEKNTICHKLNYAYAVFYCHKTMSTSSYLVSLVGFNGSSVKAVAICHKYTSDWNPKHMAFQALNVKLGTPVCHFLAEENIIWVPNN